ncbi:TPA: FAD-binding domain-containing protein [Neisseria lactamica]|uniref:FAD-binding domain-containing protein n=1 Tax=Neisseria polysaccharea TaxID=489 RepID=UPI00272AE8E6|nr:deoxyribodipyrimidine photo-lyase [Neisseria polysaccharea]
MPSETARPLYADTRAAHTLVWFRQNLRIRDNAALCAAVAEGLPIIGIWIDDAETGNPRRTAFYRQSAAELAQVLAGRGIPLYTAASPAGLVRLAVRLNIRAVIADESHTFADKLADNALWHELDKHGIALTFVNDRAVFGKTDLIPDGGTAYADFDRYREVWLDRFSKQPPAGSDLFAAYRQPFPENLSTPPPAAFSDGIFLPQNGGETAAWRQWRRFLEQADSYSVLKDFPSRKNTSLMGAYLSAGCISPRLLARESLERRLNAWADNIIRRDFFLQLALQHADDGPSDGNPEHTLRLTLWQQGRTGIPIIDAAMRCLHKTGSLHPALRRLSADFFCHVLNLPRREGEIWFARQLTDFDAAINQGNWRLAASRHTYPDIAAAAHKTDPDGTFVRRHIPELAHLPAAVIHTPWRAAGSIDTHGYPAHPVAGIP